MCGSTACIREQDGSVALSESLKAFFRVVLAGVTSPEWIAWRITYQWQCLIVFCARYVCIGGNGLVLLSCLFPCLPLQTDN